MLKRLFLATLLACASLAADAQDRSTELDQAYQEVVAAQRALEEAKNRREEIEEPEPGDRIGTAKGGSRLQPEYFERQRTAEGDVKAAEERYGRALERWNQLR